MCEGSFLPSSFGPHQKHTEFESSLRSYPINPFAFFAKRRGLFPSHVGAGALTRPGGDFFRAAEGNLLSHTCHSEERRDESLLSNTCYFHRRWRMTTVDLSHSAHHVTTEFVLPVLEDADSIQITLGQIMRMIV